MRIIHFLKKNIFYSKGSTFVTLLMLLVLLWAVPKFIDWVFFSSIWSGTSADCRQVSGACWAFINEKFNFIMVGFYPQDEIWRPGVSFIIYVVFMIYLSNYKKWSIRTPLYALLTSAAIGTLLYGGVFGMEFVDSKNWGGLILTILLTTIGITLAYPFGIILALGRRSKLPVIKTVSILYIETIRGVPLISLLFMSSVMLPFVLPPDWNLPKLPRVQLAIIMFVAAYLAEVIRGGLQAIPKGQYEASISIGLSFWQSNFLIILPQALKIVIPPTVSTFIGMFLDTTLVVIVSMFDLLGTTKLALTDSKWLGYANEAYLFLMVVFFIFCYTMARYSTNLEKKLKVTR